MTQYKTDQIVNTGRALKAMMAKLAGENWLAFDTETDGLSFDRQIVGFSVATRDQAYYVPMRHRPAGQRLPDAASSTAFQNAPLDLALEALKEIFSVEDREIWAHNWKFDLKAMRNDGIDPSTIKARLGDTMVLSWVTAETDTKRHGLKGLVKEMYGYSMLEFTTLLDNWVQGGRRKGVLPVWAIPVGPMTQYACDDVKWLDRLSTDLGRKLAAMGEHSVKVFWELEMPIIFILEEMEQNGMRLDVDHLSKVSTDLQNRMTVILQRIRTLLRTNGVDGEANIGSTQWLCRTFIQHLCWWPPIGAKGKNGYYSTKESHVQKWAQGVRGTTKAGQEVAELILEYRKAQKLRSTYTESLIDDVQADGRVHASFRQIGTRTGRFSCRNPNFQNIPRKSSVSIREAFIPRDGFTMMTCDYSQVELRLMAHFSKDETMLEVYTEGGDIHQQTADACGCTRQHAKAINFGLMYGMSPKTLAAQIKAPVNEAKVWWQRYFQKYSAVKEYQGRVITLARATGYSSTLLGRRRYLPEIKSDDWKVKGPAERKAVNTKIQGSASDVIKVAMRNIDRALKDEGYWRDGAFMLSQVHDELIFEVRDDLVDTVGGLIQREMEAAVKLRVPLIAEPSSGPNWEAAK